MENEKRALEDAVVLLSRRAWAKIMWFKEKADGNEIAGYGITRDGDPLYVEDFMTIKQEVTKASTEFEDGALNEYMIEMVKKGVAIDRCMRVHIHTHPTGVNDFSSVDEDLGKRVFKDAAWGVRIVVLSSGEMKGTLHGVVLGKYRMTGTVRVEIDLAENDVKEWAKEFVANIQEKVFASGIVNEYGYGYGYGMQRQFDNQGKFMDNGPKVGGCKEFDNQGKVIGGGIVKAAATGFKKDSKRDAKDFMGKRKENNGTVWWDRVCGKLQPGDDERRFDG